MIKKRELKKGTIEKTASYIMAVPKNPADTQSMEQIIERLKSSTEFEFIDINDVENPVVRLKYKDIEISAELFLENAEFPEMYIINQKFIGDDLEQLKKAKIGVTAGIVFGESAIEYFHIQIKLLHCLVPDILGLIDFCSCRVITGRWAMLAAKSDVPPSPDYIFTIHAVDSKSGQVWLHTHGLNRCGVIDFEILNSNENNYQTHASVLTTLSNIAVSNGEMDDEEEPKYIIDMGEDDLVVTWLDWRYALKKFPNIKNGTESDREDSHNENTGVIYVYRSEADYKKRKYSHISVYDELLADNPLMMFTTSETNRMRALATERFEYFEKYYSKGENVGIIKFGIPADDEYQNEEDETPQMEHIWFEVKEINGDKIRAILTQEPYYLSEYEEGGEYVMDKTMLTDWAIYTKTDMITPDMVYLLSDE